MAYINPAANCTEIDDLDALTKAVREHLQASANAAQNFLEHALAAGDALIRAKAQVKPGNWYSWLRCCDLSEDKAQRYMQLAAHRAELDPARVRGLSLRAALKLIAKSQLVDSKPKKKTKPATSFDALAWWINASQKERSHFLEGVGLKPLLAAIPAAWRQEAEREIGPVSSRATTLLMLALSTTSAGEAFNALGAVKQTIARCGYDLHDLELHFNNHRRFGRAA